MKHPSIYVCLVASMLLTGCAHTREPQSISVYRYDGSVQCEQGGTSVETMRKELMSEGVGVTCGRKAQDGKVYPAMCGAATGRINVFTIDGADLRRAEALGFKSVETLPDARIPPCE